MALQNSSDTAYQRLTFKSFKLSSSTCTYTSYISQNCNISISMISFIVGTHGWLSLVPLGTKRNQPWVPTMDKFIQSCHIPIRAGSLWIMRNVWQYMYGETRENCTPFKLRTKHFFSFKFTAILKIHSVFSLFQNSTSKYLNCFGKLVLRQSHTCKITIWITSIWIWEFFNLKFGKYITFCKFEQGRFLTSI